MSILVILIALGFVAFYIWVYARIVQKAGYSGWWSPTMFVPVVNIVMLWIFAFADWPALKLPKDIGDVFD